MAGHVSIHSPITGTIARMLVGNGTLVAENETLLVIESMKMEHPVRIHVDGMVEQVLVDQGDAVAEGDELVRVTPMRIEETGQERSFALGVLEDREDLVRYLERRRRTDDAARPDAVAKRHAKGRRTARENVADLVDAGSFVEFGAFAVAAQRGRKSEQELIDQTPADGLICGVATIGGGAMRIAVLAYDYTVLAGTQGFINHRKLDRLVEVARRNNLPVVLFAEGGGGRPGDVDAPGVAGLDVPSFGSFAALSGEVPLVGIAAGYCFAGNAALLGCCDIIIATRDANIGMAGPAMVEGGGLGKVAPTEIGPAENHARIGSVDVMVADESAAVAVALRYLTTLGNVASHVSRPDADLLRQVVPRNRAEIYEVRRAIDLILDVGSSIELRPQFGVGIVTVLGRIDGRSVGVLANNPGHLGGAIDRDAADKMARFIQLCDAHRLPVVSLCDTPGFMVGAQAEEQAQVRHFARLFVVAASASVPWVTIVLRKGYGLGAQAMAGGGFHAKDFIAAWPTGEFGGMGIEGAVRLGFRNEIAASDDPAGLEKRLIAAAYERGSALSMASHVEIDDVIDPRDTAATIVRVIDGCAGRPRLGRSMIDPW